MNCHRLRNRRPKSVHARTSLWCAWLVFFLGMFVAPAHAGTYDGAMGRTSYVLKSGDVNGDGQLDFLVKASSRIVMIPLDDDLVMPISVPAPSPTFVLLSGAGGVFTLVSNPAAATLDNAAWVATTSTLSFSGPQGGYADTLSIKAQGSEQAIVIVAMSAADGQLQLTANNLPTAASSEVPVPIAITDADIPQLANAVAGTLPGSLNVSSGSASYSMPIAVPPGTAGMVPNLSLSYSSDNTTGSAGLGWSIGGMSNIDRCGKTIATDGWADGVRFSASVGKLGTVDAPTVQQVDRLCLDGQRLVLINGDSNDNASYWAAGAEYRTEIESFTRVTTVIANNKRSFKVETKSGDTLYYGDTSSSYVEGAGRADGAAHRWRQSRRMDRSGNYIDYDYSKDATTGESKPVTVRWGGNSVNGQSHYAKAQLEYEARPDARTAYIAGSRNDERLRLRRIVTTTDTAADGNAGTLVHTYNLTYDAAGSPTSGRGMLTAVQVCDASSVCLPSTTFEWGKPNPNAEHKFAPLGGARAGPYLSALFNDSVNKFTLTSPVDAITIRDFNEDGKADILERFRSTSNSQQQRYYQTSADGLSWTPSAPFAGIAGDMAVMETGDFDGDGHVDILIADRFALNNWRMCWGPLNMANIDCSSPVVFPAAAFNISTPNKPDRIVKDFNADGRDDIYLTAQAANDPATGKKFQCLSTGRAFNCTDVTNSQDVIIEPDYSRTAVGNEFADVDGDGRVDKLTLRRCVWQPIDGASRSPTHEWVCENDSPFRISVNGQPERGAFRLTGDWMSIADYTSVVIPPPSTGTLTGDRNADGYSDIIFGVARTELYKELPAAVSSHVCFSKGNGEGDCRPLPPSNFVTGLNLDHLALTVGDFDGDGIVDVIRPGIDTWTVDNFNSFQLCRIGPDASFHRCEAWTGPTYYSFSRRQALSKSANLENSATRLRSMLSGDFDGDGKQDILSYLGVDQWEISSAVNQAKAGEALDKLISTTNGVGFTEKVQYAASSDANVYNATVTDIAGQVIGSSYPVKVAPPAKQLINKLSRSNGQGGWLDTTFKYYGYAVDASGRGSLGFARVDTTDNQSGSVTANWSRRDYPFVGMMLASRTTAGNGVVLSKATQDVASLSILQTSGKTTPFPYVLKSKVERRDLSGHNLGTVTTTTNDYDQCGNSRKTSVDSVLNPGEIFLAETNVEFDPDPTKCWHGEALKITETKTVPGSVVSRMMEYTYDAKGRRDTETRQSDDPLLRLKTTYGRSLNVFGLVDSTTLGWTDVDPSKGTRVVNTTTYDAKGRFPQTSKNALKQVTTTSFDARTGAPASITDSNGLTTTWTADGFGRKYKELGPDGTEKRTYTRKCTAGTCPPGAQVVTIIDTLRAGVRVAAPVLSYQDNGGRVLQLQSWGFDGRKIVTVNSYDSQGRLNRSDWPRFEAGSPFMASSMEYDELNRVVKLTTVDVDGALLLNETKYEGTNITFINPKLQSKKDTRDVWGRLTTSLDALLGVTGYEHDAYNNLKKTTDPRNNVVTIEYDKWGRKTNLRDPDLGWIKYDVDPLGQVTRQISPVQRALGQSVTFKYDDLGRMYSRVEPDLVSGWDFDKAAGQSDCALTKSCGKLVEAYTVSGGVRDYRRTQSYDALGRPDTTSTYLDTTYTTKSEYDAWGRPIRQRHQRAADASKVFDNRYNAYGYLSRIERGSLVLWRATKQDASQRLTGATLGNGLNVTRAYDDHTGQLMDGQVTQPTDTAQLQEGYHYDVLGNVSSRTQYWPGQTGFTEAFIYDELNRLKIAKIDAVEQRFTYDAIGNMLSKTGVGTGDYVYPTQGAGIVRPHAVQSIPGLGAFLYDDNGNLKSGDKRTLRWTSFDMPLDIVKVDGGTFSSAFVYGAEHQRIRQDKSDGTRTYYAGSMEVETRSGVRTVKTYWPMGLGVEIEKPTATELNWTHLDRIGSVVAISDQSGNLREKLAYDSWGKRRALTGSLTPNTIDGVTDNRGFTGHEMLDQLDLVHMNGRVYDPTVARFMSADPIIQDPEHSQSYNRYTYVWNNPTNLTDPTGFVVQMPSSIDRQNCDQRAGCNSQTGTADTGTDEKKTEEKNSPSSSTDNAANAGKNAPRSAITVRSPEIMRALVPGQVQWDDARTDFANDNYGGAALHTGLMVGEQVMTVFTLGAYQGSRTVVQTTVIVEQKIVAARAAEKAGEVLAKGFKGIDAKEIIEINRGLGSGGNAYRAVETVAANAKRYDGFMAKGSSMIRDIAGGHLFENGNKRTAVEVMERLIRRNGVDGPPTQLIWKVVDQVATGQLKTVPEIAKALRGF